MAINLLLHKWLLHLFTFSMAPWQESPPKAGDGELHFRVDLLLPLPQGWSQLVHEDHWLSPPCTAIQNDLKITRMHFEIGIHWLASYPGLFHSHKLLSIFQISLFPRSTSNSLIIVIVGQKIWWDLIKILARRKVFRSPNSRCRGILTEKAVHVNEVNYMASYSKQSYLNPYGISKKSYDPLKD